MTVADAKTVSFEGNYPASRPRNFLMIPLDVPSGTARIDITYNCESDLSFGLNPGENPHDFFADIAVFDSRGAGFNGDGYRGTSGNSRTHISIAADTATPGYMPGPIQPGEWQIMLGFYKVAPTGTNYQLWVTMTPGESVVTEPPPRLPLRSTSTHPINSSGWYKGELHCHTFHSDGTPSPEEVVAEAERLGLDFLSVTDHNVFTQQVPLNQVKTDVMLIPGCEVTTFNGHWNIWGDAGWIEFRATTEAEMNAAYAEANRRGYLTSLNHPRPEGPPWRFPNTVGNTCIEVWNGDWENNNDICLGFWVERINAGKRFVAVGGSDCHQLNTPGEGKLARPTTYIYCEDAPSAAGILNGLRAGHAFITQAPDGPQLYLSSGSAIMGDAVPAPANHFLNVAVHVVDGAGMALEIWTAKGKVESCPVSSADETINLAVDVADTPYVRAQLRDPASGHPAALTNPIYLDR